MKTKNKKQIPIFSSTILFGRVKPRVTGKSGTRSKYILVFSVPSILNTKDIYRKVKAN
jgi:hypothetical protein